MEKKLTTPTKVILILIAVYGCFAGGSLIIEPQWLANLYGYTAREPENMRLLGASMFSLSAACGLAVMTRSWTVSRILIKAGILYTFLNMIVIPINMIVDSNHSLNAYLVRISVWFIFFILVSLLFFLNDKRR